MPEKTKDTTNEPLIITTESTPKGMCLNTTINRTLDTPKSILPTKKESSTESIQWKIPIK